MNRVEPFMDRAGKWRFRIVAPNGRRVATSGESFHDRWNAERAIDDLLIGLGPAVDEARERRRQDAVVAPV